MHKAVVFSEGQQIENNFNMDLLVIQVEDLVLWARLDNTHPFDSLGGVLIHKGLSTLLSR